MSSSEYSARIKRLALVGASFLHLGVARGIRGTYGVFYVTLIEAFGWSRAATAGAISLSIIFEGISFPFVGSLTDRLGPRRTLVVGGSLLALGLGFSATISSLWQLYLWLGLVTSLGLGLIGMVPHVAMLAREFSKHRGAVLGLAYAGGGVGMLLLVPLTQIMIDSWSWSVAYVGLAGITALLVVPPAWFILTPKSGQSVQSAKAEGKKTDRTVKDALTSLSFWLLFSSRVLASMGNQIVITHQIAHAVDAGFSKLFAASIFGLMGVVSIFGRVFFGSLSDRMRGESVFTLVQVISTLGIASLMAVQDQSFPALLYGYALFYGLGQGSRALVLSTISADLFLGKNFGAIYGYFTMSIGVGGAFGAWLGGFIHDTTDSYFIAFLVAMFCFIASTINIWQVRRSPKSIEGK